MESNIESNRKHEIVAYFLLILTTIIWGGTWPLGRWLVSEEVGGATIPPFMIAVIRYFLAVNCFFLILRFKEGTLNWQFAKKNWKILVLMGLLSVTIYQAGYLIGEIFTSASDASIMVATNAVWVVILSSTFLKTERFAWRKLVGSLLAFTAVVFVVGFSPNVNVANRILGDIMILLAAFAYAIYTVISRFFLTKTQEDSEAYQPSSIWIMTYVSLFGFLITTPIALIISPEFLLPTTYLTVPPRVWVGISYLAFISTIGAYTFYLEGVKRLNASRAAIFQALVPLFGVLFSALFLHEQFDILVYPFALALVIIGITLVNRNSRKNSKKLRNPIQVLIYPVRKTNEGWEYLMLKRIKSRGGFWQGVTGAPESDETITEGAKRELFEETGFRSVTLIQTDISYIIPMEDRWIDIYPKGTIEIPEYLFIAKIHQPGAPKIDPIEHDDWKWCSYEEAMNLLSWEDSKKALEYVQKYLEEIIIKLKKN